MTEFKLWMTLQATLLLVVFLAMLSLSVLRAEATVIRDLRIGSTEDYVRMVLEFDRPLPPPPSFSIDGNVLQVNLTGIIKDLPAIRTKEYGDDVVSTYISNVSKARRIEVVFSFDPADVKTFFLTDPDRFIIDALRPVSSPAASLAGETAPQMPSIGEDIASPLSPSKQRELAPITSGGAARKDEASIDADVSVAINRHTADGSNRNRLQQGRIQQRLIVALIVTTSIIVVLLIFLIWMEGGRKKTHNRSWPRDQSLIDQLPPSTEPHIQSLDSVIRKHLKSHDPMWRRKPGNCMPPNKEDALSAGLSKTAKKDLESMIEDIRRHPAVDDHAESEASIQARSETLTLRLADLAEMVLTIDRQMTPMVEVVRLSHQKSELLNQRLDAVIAALKKGQML